MLILNTLLLILGLVLLTLGSNWLVKGASSLAFSFSIRPIVVGLTIVAFATSAPEFLVSLVASIKGSSGISVGNIIGSNIMNIALVLGLSAMIRPLTVNSQVVRRELPYMILFSIILWVVCFDGKISRIDGIILFSGLVLFLVYGFYTSKETNMELLENSPSIEKKYALNTVLILIGLAGLAGGADMVVKNAIQIARSFNISDLFIGLSIVAIGTSLPELATSVVAVYKNENDISLGNVVGSNIFNICMVLGMVGLLNPLEGINPSLNNFEFPLMIALSVILFFITRFQGRISRGSGLFFTGTFCFYLYFSYYLSTH